MTSGQPSIPRAGRDCAAEASTVSAALFSEAVQHAVAAERERIAQFCETYGEVNFEICGDSILLDPLLRGGPWTPENVALSEKLQVDSAIHSAKFHACQEIAQAIRSGAHSEPSA